MLLAVQCIHLFRRGQVLAAHGFIVQRGQRQPFFVGQVALPQPMGANQLQRAALARPRDAQRLIFDLGPFAADQL